MAIGILAAAGAAAAKTGAVVAKTAAAATKVGAETAKVGGQVAATSAQTATAGAKAAATVGADANAIQALAAKSAHGGNSALLPKDAMDLKTGKTLPDEELKGQSTVLGEDLTSKIESMKELYCNELKQFSPCDGTLDIDSIKHGSFHRLSPEETMARRLEFDKMKPDLIREWESRNHLSWPRYDHDVYSNAGNIIRPKGGLFDAHHAHPLGMGGKNTPENITPMNATNHYDKQGIHAPGSAYDQLFKLLEA